VPPRDGDSNLDVVFRCPFHLGDLNALIRSQYRALAGWLVGVRRKACRKMRIPLPKRGHWAKIAAGHKLKRPPLPALKDGEPSEYRMRPLSSSSARVAPEVAAALEKELSPESQILVASELTSPHPLVAEAAAVLAKVKPSKEGLLRRRDRRCLDLQVSPALLDRALRIMDALLKALELRGYTVETTAQSRWTPPPWRPVLPYQSRWTLLPWWPVLAATPRASRRTGAPRSRPRADTRSPVPDEQRSLSRSAAATTPVAPASRFDVSSRRPKRWPSRRGTTAPPPRQRLGRYSWWPVFSRPSVAGFGCPPRSASLSDRRPDDAASRLCNQPGVSQESRRDLWLAQNGGEFPEDPLQRARAHAARLVPGRRSVQLDEDGEAARGSAGLNAAGSRPTPLTSVDAALGWGEPRSAEAGFSAAC
jgi:hypothetical protein